MTSYSLKDKRRLKATLKLDSLPDDEFMALAERAKSAARHPRARPRRARATTPDALEVSVAEATVGQLLARAKEAKGESNSQIATRLGVSRQRVAEMLGSHNLKVGTVVATAAALGYETRISLHPVDNSGPDLEAVLPSGASIESAARSSNRSR